MALTKQQQALADLMSEISEYCWFAGWLTGTEFRLWQFLVDREDDPVWGNYPIPEGHRPELERLSKAIGGWIYWRDGPEVPNERAGLAFC